MQAVKKFFSRALEFSKKIAGDYYDNLAKKPVINLFIITFLLSFVDYLFRVVFVEDGFDASRMKEIGRALLDTFIMNLILFHLFYAIFRRFFVKFLYVFFAFMVILFVVDFFLLKNFAMHYSIVALDAMIHTNLDEGREFIISYFDTGLLLFLIIFVSLATYIFRAEFKLLSARIRPYFCFVYVIYAFLFIAYVSDKIFIHQQIRKGNYVTKIQKKLSKNIFLNFAITTGSYFSNDGLIAGVKKVRAAYDEQKAANSGIIASNQIKNVVFIIGESFQRRHASLYGYERETTPNLTALQASNNLIAFSNVVSPMPNTELALKRVLNFSNYESAKPWYESLNLVDLFALLGYKTYWLSNQKSMNTSVVMYSSESRAHYARHAEASGVSYDDVLIPMIKAKSAGEKNLFVVHIIGSHPDYASRYPRSEFAKFSSADIDTPNLSEKEKRELAHYDNSIFFNDYVINEIYNIFKDKEALIIYFSDHGQLVYEYKHRKGHSSDTKWGYEIPLVFIASDEFKAKFGRIWLNLDSAKNKKIMSDDLIHALCDIMGARPREYDPKHSFLSPEFNENRKRLVLDEIDYDEKLEPQKAEY